MTLFIDLRATPSGGICANEARAWEDGTRPVTTGEFAALVHGRDLMLATHGFNVSRGEGIKALSCWERICELLPACLFIGVLWPGDSRFIPVLNYPFEGDDAMACGRLLAGFLNREAVGAASISLISHSLGARVVLEAAEHLNRKVRRLILMAGAIEDDCLVEEYASAARNAEKIYTLASKKDRVLQFAFPIGNPVGEIVMRGHPYFDAAIGREGPSNPISLEQQGGAWQIPRDWDYGHGDYLPDDPVAQKIPLPVVAPAPQTQPGTHFEGWKPAWSASAVSTQVS
jgi:pimeloyl-ACP methyl ester carboxylesterase